MYSNNNKLIITALLDKIISCYL